MVFKSSVLEITKPNGQNKAEDMKKNAKDESQVTSNSFYYGRPEGLDESDLELFDIQTSVNPHHPPRVFGRTQIHEDFETQSVVTSIILSLAILLICICIM